MFYVIVASGECPGKCPWEYPDCMYVTSTVQSTDLHIYYLDAVPPIHIVSNHVDTDKPVSYTHLTLPTNREV